MNIEIETVRHVFCEVLSGKITREDADRWAYSIIQQSEVGSLVFVPDSKRDSIWSGVMYLYGIDTMEGPGEYLHTDEDIEMAMLQKLSNSEGIEDRS